MIALKENEKVALQKEAEKYAAIKGFVDCGVVKAKVINNGEKFAVVGYKKRENPRNVDFPYYKVILAKISGDKVTNTLVDTQINFCVKNEANLIYLAQKELNRLGGEISTTLKDILPLYKVILAKEIFDADFKTYKTIFVEE